MWSLHYLTPRGKLRFLLPLEPARPHVRHTLIPEVILTVDTSMPAAVNPKSTGKYPPGSLWMFEIIFLANVFSTGSIQKFNA